MCQPSGNRPAHLDDQVGKEAFRQMRRLDKTRLSSWISTGVQIDRHQKGASLRPRTQHRRIQEGQNMETLQNH